MEFLARAFGKNKIKPNSTQVAIPHVGYQTRKNRHMGDFQMNQREPASILIGDQALTATSDRLFGHETPPL